MNGHAPRASGIDLWACSDCNDRSAERRSVTLERLLDYLRLPLATSLRPRALVLPLLLAVGLTAGSVGLVHLWLPGPQPLRLVLMHAAQVAAAYTLWLVAMAGVLAPLRRSGRLGQLRVGHLWMISLVCYVLGYFVDLFRGDLVVTLHPDLADSGSLFHFLRLFPVWLVVTFLLVQPWAHGTLAAEIARLNDLNRRLAARLRLPQPADGSLTRGATQIANRRLTVELGRTRLDLPIEAVTHISVDDHYCYVHHCQDGQAGKTALGMPLRDLQPLLPEHFMQVHRSHVVNLHAVTGVVRDGRGHRLAVPGVQPLPVSRQRLREVLARLEDGGTGALR